MSDTIIAGLPLRADARLCLRHGGDGVSAKAHAGGAHHHF